MDELEQRIRAARPVSGHRHLPLSDRAKRELADLMLVDAARTTRTPHPRRRAGLLAVAGAAIAVVAAVVAGAMATSVLVAPHAAYAATPPLLDTTATSESAQELLTQMSRTAANRTASSDGTYAISVQMWSLSITDGVATSTSIVPEDYELTRTADGGFSTRVTYGQPFDQNGSPLDGEDLPTAGELSWEDSWAPGEYQFVFPGSFPTSSDEVGRYLSTISGATLPLSASESIQAMNSLLMEQKLDARQQAAFLSYLADLPDLHAAGGTVDRLGRDGVVFTTEDLGFRGYEDHIIVSPDTGQVLAIERIYHGNHRTDIASPSVVSYSFWE